MSQSNNFEVITCEGWGEFVNGVELDDYWMCFYKVKCDLDIIKTQGLGLKSETTEEEVVFEIPGVWEMGNLIEGIKWNVGKYVREKYPVVSSVMVSFKVFEKERSIENVDNWNDGAEEEEEEEEENDF